MSIIDKPLYEIREAILNKEVTSEDVVNAFIAQIEAQNDDINAVLTIAFDEALETARRVDEKIAKGEEVGALAGIPLIIKDNISTKDIRTTCASKILENYVPIYDATVIEKLKEADAIILGKANMDEFAMGSANETSYFGAVKNPRVPSAVPGGSSGGSAAAVAAGMCPASLGSDTGGSVRQPSAFCGIYGLKPTYGAVSRYGLIAFASSLDQVGPLGKHPRDLALIMNVISGYDSKDSTSANIDFEDFGAHLDEELKNFKIGVPEEYLGEEIAPSIKARLDEVKTVLAELGANVEACHLANTKYAVPAYYFIATAEASSNLARYDGVRYGFRAQGDDLVSMFQNTRQQGFGDEVKRRIMLGTYALSAGYYDAYYVKALKVRRLIQEDFEKVFETYDCVLTPTTVGTAFDRGQNFPAAVLYKQDICTVTSNLAGLPALSIPCGTDDEGRPIGLQLIGPAFSEGRLLQIANQLNMAFERGNK